MTGPVLLSVVVCTHNRPADLRRCLDGLARLHDPVEVIVVDSASSPPCAALVESFAGGIPVLRYRYIDRPGLSRARNAGVSLATSEVVAFLDDDAVPAPNWARELTSAFADGDVACVGGTCAPEFRSPRPPWLSDRLLQYAGITRFGDRPRVVRRSTEYPFGANMAFRRSDLRAIGGFSEDLGRMGSSLLSGEEYAAVDAVRSRGRTVRLAPAAMVAHSVAPERCRGGYYWRRLWWQGVGRARADARFRTLLRVLLAAPLRAGAWLVTADRFFLYRLAETPAYVAEFARLLAARAGGACARRLPWRPPGATMRRWSGRLRRFGAGDADVRR